MRFFLMLLAVVLSSPVNADDCRSEKAYNHETHTFLGCKVSVTTPSYYVRANFPANGGMTEVGCTFYCNYKTIVPLALPQHAGPRIKEISRDTVDLILDYWRRYQSPLPPERFIQYTLTEIYAPNEEQQVQELWDAYVESKTHQRDTSQILPPESYQLLSLKDFSEKELNSEHESLKCPVCQEKVQDLLKEEKDIVKINCDGHHVFCKSCIEESYQFQQTCPSCRGPIH